jgi:hypothetical protein
MCRASRAISELARVGRPKKSHRHALHRILIDQHGDMGAALQRFEQSLRRAGAGRDQHPHATFAHADHRIGDGGDARPAIEHRRVDAVGMSADRGELPVRQMCGEDQRRLAVVAQPERNRLGRVGIHHAAWALARRIVIPQSVDMGELGADPAEIVPDAAEDRLDLGGRFLRKRGGEIGAADAVLRQPRPDAAHHLACEIRHGADIDQPDAAQQLHREEAEHRVAGAPQP